MGFSIPEIIIILIVALIVIGPDKLPDVAKSIGKGYGEFRRALGDIKKNVDLSIDKTAKSTEAAKTYRETYKSRWEAQVEGSPPEDSKNTPKTESDSLDTQVSQEAKSDVRTKRSDLINEDENGG